MKVLSTSQIRELDAYTIRHEPVQSIDLMERAARALTTWLVEHLGAKKEVLIVCGAGNNGGDGLACVRLLATAGWKVTATYPEFRILSEDAAINLRRLDEFSQIMVLPLSREAPIPDVSPDVIIIDALFGSGLNRTVEGAEAQWIDMINSLPNLVIAIDIPSGLFADEPTTGPRISADFTLSLELPKLAFFIPENDEAVGEWITLPIGLHAGQLNSMVTPWHTLTADKAGQIMRTRRKYDHKGTYGHALLIAGSYGKAGAAILSARAALRSGAGLVTVHTPRLVLSVIQSAVPEAMALADVHDFVVSDIPTEGSFTATGIGPGIGTDDQSVSALQTFLTHTTLPSVLDADALNILGMHKDFLDLLPRGTILTPHFKEFKRLFGASTNHFARLETLRNAARERSLIIILKGAHTAIALPDGSVWFNTTGNPGMASAGTGDVLTGIIAGLLAQRFPAVEAAMLGVYIHGLAGDIAADQTGYEALIAGDIVGSIGAAYRFLHEGG